MTRRNRLLRLTTRSSPLGKITSLFLAMTLVTLEVGCKQNVDLASIQKFTQTSLDQGPQFAALAGDFYQSCRRGHIWRLIGSVPPQPLPAGLTTAQQRSIEAALAAQKQAQAAVDSAVRSRNQAKISAASTALRKTQAQLDTARSSVADQAVSAFRQASQSLLRADTSGPRSSAGAATPNPPSSSQATFGANNGDVCYLELQASDQWQKANLVLLNYVRALGDLAGAHESNTNAFGFDSLANELVASKALSADQATTYQTFAGQLARDIFSAGRRDAIARYAPEATQALGKWIDILEYVANTNYRFVLTNERQALNHFFLDNFQATQSGLPAFEALQYKSTWKTELSDIDGRLQAISGYVNTLEALRKAHNALVQKSAQRNFADFYEIVTVYITEYQPELDKIRKAFAPTTKSTTSR